VRQYLEGVRGAIPLAAEQLDVLLRLCRGLDRPVGRLLDLGCGDGVLAAALLEAFPEATAVAADFSPTMLEAARTRFAAMPARVDVVEIDYASPAWREELPRGRYDVIVSGFSIHHQPDGRKRELYGEIFGLLEPGGLFANVEHVSSAGAWGQSLAEEHLVDSFHAYQQQLGSALSREEVARKFVYRDDKDANILAPVELQCGWLREIGFEDVDCFLKIYELAVFGGRKPA